METIETSARSAPGLPGALPGGITSALGTAASVVDSCLGDSALSNNSVLIVDDEPQILSLFAEALARHGYHALTAGDAAAALEVLERDPQVVFLDLKLPGTDGVQVFQAMRQVRPAVPVVIITGYPRDSLVEAAMNLGAFACLVKPFSMSDVLAILGALGLRAAA